jgi:hypothetical protein
MAIHRSVGGVATPPESISKDPDEVRGLFMSEPRIGVGAVGAKATVSR